MALLLPPSVKHGDAPPGDTPQIAIFEELLRLLLARLDGRFARETEEALRILDSTVISLSAKNHRWAAFRVNNAAIKLRLRFDPDAQCPTFLSLIDYLIPLWAVMVDMIFRAERTEWTALSGSAMPRDGAPNPKPKSEKTEYQSSSSVSQ